MNKALNKLVSQENFVDKDENDYIYASFSKPPLKIISKNNSDDVMDFTVECPTCKGHINFGTEIFMLSGDHYCINKGCRETLLQKENYNYVYEGMNNGRYDEVVTSSKTFGEVTQITVRKVKKACKELSIDFDDFMKYAQERKAKENQNGESN